MIAVARQQELFTASNQSALERAFWKFHRDNAHVYERLREMALTLLRRGVTHWGIGGLWEVLRWEHAIGTRRDGDEPFRLNNNLRSGYARELMAQESALRGFFRTRESEFDGV